MNPLIRVAVQPGSAAAGFPDEALGAYDTVVVSGLSLGQVEALETSCTSESEQRRYGRTCCPYRRPHGGFCMRAAGKRLHRLPKERRETG